MIKQHETFLNLDNYQMVSLTPEEMQETKGGWVVIAALVVAALLLSTPAR